MRVVGLPDVGIFLSCIEARTGFAGIQVMVTDDERRGVGLAEVGEEGAQGTLLGVGARVGRFAVEVETSFVTYSDGVFVVTLAVCADDFLWTAWLN